MEAEEGDGVERVQALEPDALESSIFDLLLYDPGQVSFAPQFPHHSSY